MGRDQRTGDREKNIEFRDVVIDNWPRLFGTAVRVRFVACPLVRVPLVLVPLCWLAC